MTTEFQNVVLGKFVSQPLKMKKKLSNLQTKTSFKERAMSSLIFLCSSIACSVMKSIRNSLTFLKIQILSLRHLNWLPKLLGLIGLLSLLSDRKDKLISLTFLAILTNKVLQVSRKTYKTNSQTQCINSLDHWLVTVNQIKYNCQQKLTHKWCENS